jgi:hypothetical protein
MSKGSEACVKETAELQQVSPHFHSGGGANRPAAFIRFGDSAGVVRRVVSALTLRGRLGRVLGAGQAGPVRAGQLHVHRLRGAGGRVREPARRAAPRDRRLHAGGDRRRRDEAGPRPPPSQSESLG